MRRTIAPQRTRKRPLLPSFFHKNGPGGSGFLPTPAPLQLVLHHCPDDYSGRLSNLLTKRWRAPRRYTGSRQTNLPPWSGRAGSPGEGQSRPNLQRPRRLQAVLPSCINNWNETQHILENQLTTYQNSSPIFCLRTINF